LERRRAQIVTTTTATGRTTTAKPANTTNLTVLDDTCDEHCFFEGKTETCKAHLQRVAFEEFLGDPRSCALARQVAIKRCPVCEHCSLQSAGCKILAPVTTPKPPEKNCDNVCGFDGKFVTCKVRIQWASSHTFQFRDNSCKLGHELVQKQCVACGTCPLEKANCTDSDPDAPGAPPPPVSPSPYDCDKGLSNWQMGWTQDKGSWCCKHEGKGCPTGSVDHDGPVEKPKHDCLKGLGHFEDEWDDEKRAWCCNHEHLGCSAHAIFKKFDNHAGPSPGGLQLRKQSPPSHHTLTVLVLLSASGSLVLLATLSLVRHYRRATTVRNTMPSAPQSYSRELIGGKAAGIVMALE
jgi:hypothetical protein